MRKTTIKVRKRIETNSIQLPTDRFNIMRNYAKSVGGCMTIIHSKPSAFTALQTSAN